MKKKIIISKTSQKSNEIETQNEIAEDKEHQIQDQILLEQSDEDLKPQEQKLQDQINEDLIPPCTLR